MKCFKSLYLAFMAVFFLTVLSASAEIVLDDTFYHGFDKEGKFVTIPTYTGNFIGAGVGIFPAGIARGAFMLFSADEKAVSEASTVGMKCVATPLGFCLGLPFYALKMFLWEGPGLLFGAMNKDNSKPVPASSLSEEVILTPSSIDTSVK